MEMRAAQYAPPAGVQFTAPSTSDTRELLRLLTQRRWGFLFAALIGVLIGWLYLLGATPTWETTALIRVTDDNGVDRIVTPGARQSGGADPIGDNAELIRSSEVLSPVIGQFGLDTLVEPVRVPALSELSERFPKIAQALEQQPLTAPYNWRGGQIELLDLSVPAHLLDTPLTVTALSDARFAMSNAEQILIRDASVGSVRCV